MLTRPAGVRLPPNPRDLPVPGMVDPQLELRMRWLLSARGLAVGALVIVSSGWSEHRNPRTGDATCRTIFAQFHTHDTTTGRALIAIASFIQAALPGGGWGTTEYLGRGALGQSAMPGSLAP